MMTETIIKTTTGQKPAGLTVAEMKPGTWFMGYGVLRLRTPLYVVIFGERQTLHLASEYGTGEVFVPLKSVTLSVEE